MQDKKHTTAIILAAGNGSRMNMPIAKQRIEILGKTMLSRTLSAFERAGTIDDIIVVAAKEDMAFANYESLQFSKVKFITCGGKTRAESAKIGFMLAKDEAEFVAFHDCARCLISPLDIDRVVCEAYEYGAASAGRVISDTVKQIDEKGFCYSTIDRDRLMLAQTPQVFETQIYSKALEKASEDVLCVTDDNQLVENLSQKIKMVITLSENIKITTKEDLKFAEFILKEQK